MTSWKGQFIENYRQFELHYPHKESKRDASEVYVMMDYDLRDNFNTLSGWAKDIESAKIWIDEWWRQWQQL